MAILYSIELSIGGFSDDLLAIIECSDTFGFAKYNVVTKTWSLPSDYANVPQQRRLMSAAWTPSGVAYIWGGYSDVYSGES
ncbi:hypothetical protein BC938DRAFT_480948 [Jimgerdemannia flammicorona]|uniref:Uncharacterized protein n=1 Tax=Jimgerdemannia flammicorona TaxID=994334 RepID=A0A433QX46_9FUNG|nr:hypothetical protein BC938DRAFT_480948 [Jimgerdemannia flammicorona]